MNLLNWNEPHNHQELEHAARKSNGSVKRTPGHNGPGRHCGETWEWSELPVEAGLIVQSRHVMAAGEAAVGLGRINSICFPELALIRVIPAPFSVMCQGWVWLRGQLGEEQTHTDMVEQKIRMKIINVPCKSQEPRFLPY